jgi:guanine nucleotide-binding protein G(I)/G(S)/G(T) subunit beta-1
MANDVSPEAMQTRIQQARREAENLKDRIKRKKDDLADGTRESPVGGDGPDSRWWWCCVC